MSSQLIAIQQKIYEIRGLKIMLDFDLSALYEVETRILNQAVKRNIVRFPEDFMFRLNLEEWEKLKGTICGDPMSRSQIVIGSQKFRTELPLVFTQQGVSMLASVLRSEKAIAMNIAIVRAFVLLQQHSLLTAELARQVKKIRKTIKGHDEQLAEIYRALDLLIGEDIRQKKWAARERIGYKN